MTAKAAAAAGVATGAASTQPAVNGAASSGGGDGDAAEAAGDPGRPTAAAAGGAAPEATTATANGTAGGAANGTAANGTAAAAHGGTADREAASAPSDAQQLAAEFDGFDEALIGSMLEDQGGDIKEVRYYLQVGGLVALPRGQLMLLYQLPRSPPGCCCLLDSRAVDPWRVCCKAVIVIWCACRK